MAIYEKPTANTTCNAEMLIAFSHIRNKTICSHHFYSTVCWKSQLVFFEAKHKVKWTLFIDLGNLDNSVESYCI